MVEQKKDIANKPEAIDLPDGITQEMVDEAKKKHGSKKVAIGYLPMDDEGENTLAVLLKVPDRDALSEFEKWSDRNPKKSKEILVNACLLSHKDQVKADDELFLTCVNAIADLIPVRKAIVKKL